MDLLSKLDWLSAFAQLVLGFSFVIFVHELGHFLAAKWTGIKVTQFALFFGPAIFSWRKGIGFRRGSTEPELNQRVNEYLAKEKLARSEEVPSGAVTWPPTDIDRATAALGLGETEYRINWVPLGGYVKMLGQEDMDPAAQSNDPRAFNRKPVWARACVISAGVVMNLIFGVIFFIIAFMAGVDFNPSIVGDVSPVGPGARVYAEGHQGEQAYRGLQPGDRIRSVDGEEVGDFGEMAVNAALVDPLPRSDDEPLRGRPIPVVIDRPLANGQTERLTYVISPAEDGGLGLLGLGVDKAMDVRIGEYKKQAVPEPLRSAGVKSLMHVVAVNDQPVSEFYQIQRAVNAARGEPVTLTFAYPPGKRVPKGVDPATTATLEIGGVPELTLKELPAGEEGREFVAHLMGLAPAVSIKSVQEKSPAEAGGLMAGDVLVQIGDVKWPTQPDVFRVIRAARGGEVAFVVLRDGEEKKIGPIKPGAEGTVGIVPTYTSPVVRAVVPGTPADKLGLSSLNAGSRIVAVNGQAVESFSDVQRAVQDAIGEQPRATTLELTAKLNVAGSPETKVELAIDDTHAGEILAAGWAPAIDPTAFEPALVKIQADGPIEAAQIGVAKTGQFMVQTYLTLARLFQGTVKASHLQGPIGIADAGTRIRREGGFYHLLWFLGLISANLAVINFLPIPVVDGGLMTLLIIEKLKGSPVSPKVQVAITYVGLALILSLFLYVTYHDVSRIAGRLFGI